MTTPQGLPSWLRPMRRKDREIQDTDRIWEILQSADVCHVAFCSEDWPYIVSLNYGCWEKRLYFHCATEGLKLDLLGANANVCFEVETDVRVVPGRDACNWSVCYQSVVGFGKAVLVEDAQERRTAIRALLAQYSEGKVSQHAEGATDAMPPASGDVTLFRIDVLSLTGKESLGD